MIKKLSRFFGRPVVKWIVGILAAIAVASGLLWLIWIGYSYDWTGFSSYINAKGEFQRAKSLWDWLELLIVPIVLAVGALLFNRSERRAEREIADRRAQQDRDLADQRAQQDRNLASQRAQDVALQSYLDKMTELLLENGLRKSEQGSGVRVIARARTLTALTGLDGRKRALLLRFLYEADMVTKGEAVIDLRGATLVEANLSRAFLSGAVLREADLSGADLSEAILSEADLSVAILSGADLSMANLTEAKLSGAKLSGTKLSRAILSGAVLSAAILSGADLTSAIVSEEQLAQAKSLRGATMPDGTKHE